MKHLLIKLFLIIIFVSCQSDGRIDLDDVKKKGYSFSELPNEVKEIIEGDINEIAKDYNYHASTDRKVNLKYERAGGGKTWLEEINNNYHFFNINNKDFKLRGNQGDPFIIHDSVLYFTTELNFFEERYKDAHYIGIDLTQHLEK